MTIPLQQHWDAFLEAVKVRGYSPATLASYRSSLSIFGTFLSQRAMTDLRAVTSSTLRDYQIFLHGRHFAAGTILARLQAVRRFFDYQERTQALLLNPFVGLPLPKIAQKLPHQVLSVAEAHKLLETPDAATAMGARDRAILEVFYSCGLRLAELTRLRVGELDLINGFLRVNGGKGAKDRVVPLGRRAGDCLRHYLDGGRRGWISSECAEQAVWLSAHPPHSPLKSQAIAVMVKQRGRQAGLAHTLTPHVWRHTCATHLVAGGANVAYVQRLLGHASLRTTQIYVRTAIREIQETHALTHPRNLPTTP